MLLVLVFPLSLNKTNQTRHGCDIVKTPVDTVNTQTSPSGTNNHVHHPQSHIDSFFSILMLVLNLTFTLSTCLNAMSGCHM